MAEQDKKSYFSVSTELIPLGVKLDYDLYINASGSSERDHFVKVYSHRENLSKDDIKDFKKKYNQLYVLESERSEYLKSIIQNPSFKDIDKTTVIKDSAIKHLDNLFDSEKEFNTEVLQEAVEACKESVGHMVSVVKGYDIGKLRDLIAKLSFHDFYTYDHSINVSMYCIAILQGLHPAATEEELTIIGLGGLLHDLGKIKIPTTIINNPGKLSDEDFKTIKKHPGYGLDLLNEGHCHCEGIDFEVIKRVVYEHHENYNGTGYPNKLEGEDIHLYARITAVADFFDAVTTKRSYHEVLTTEEAIKVMAKTVGKKLDPKIFSIFLKTIQNKDKDVMHAADMGTLPESFDPCQPHATLPFVECKDSEFFKGNLNSLKQAMEAKKLGNYGKVTSEGDLFSVVEKKKDKKKKVA